jgi:hypothetical protein
MLDIIYARSLFQKEEEIIRSFEFLQDEFQKYPTFSVLLFEYGKLVTESSELSFYGSGVGALEEALISCVPE